MIQVVESTPLKLSGITSLFIKADYNQQLIDLVKTFQPAVWHKNLNCWEIPHMYLAAFLDGATFLDQIEFHPAINEIGEISFSPLTEEEINSFKVKPFDHQVEAINFLLAHPKALELDAPGCGKTLTAMCYAETLHRRGLIDHCLIIVGFSSLKQNWKKEIKKFSNESVVVIGEKISKNGKVSYATLPERAKQLKEPISEFFTVINIEVLRDKNVIEAISNSANKFGLIVVDEIHHCAGIQSSQYEGLKKLKADYKVGLTGSLITNNPLSAFGPLSFTENDHATLTNYKNQYCVFGTSAFTQYQIVGFKNLDQLKEEIDNCSIRRTFDMISDSLPERIIEMELVEMSDEHKKFYEAVKNGVKEEADKVHLTTGNLLALTTRLRQATSAPSVLDSDPPESSKLLRCVDLVEELAEQNEKVVVLSVFKEPVYQLAAKLEKFRPLINTGDQTEQQVSENIDKFQSDPNCLIFLGTHSRVGTGVTLNAAKYMIMLDTPWTWANFDQSACRIYRINNKNAAYIKVLAAQDSIDERVWEIVENKKELADYLVDGVENSVSDSLNSEMRNILAGL